MARYRGFQRSASRRSSAWFTLRPLRQVGRSGEGDRGVGRSRRARGGRDTGKHLPSWARSRLPPRTPCPRSKGKEVSAHEDQGQRSRGQEPGVITRDDRAGILAGSRLVVALFPAIRTVRVPSHMPRRPSRRLPDPRRSRLAWPPGASMRATKTLVDETKRKEVIAHEDQGQRSRGQGSLNTRGSRAGSLAASRPAVAFLLRSSSDGASSANLGFVGAGERGHRWHTLSSGRSAR
jgi:hypothetical protein